MLEDGTDLRRPYPKLATGVVHSRSENQLFLQTQPTLVLGMCGGPVCLDMGTGTGSTGNGGSSDNSGSTGGNGVKPVSRKKSTNTVTNTVTTNPNIPNTSTNTPTAPAPTASTLIGVVEGIVPLDYHEPHMQGLAVIVEADEILP